MIRSVLAVLAGFFAMVVVVMVSTPLLAKWLIPGFSMRGPMQPTPRYLVANLLVSGLAALGGGWVTAMLAHRAPLLHGAALAALMVVMSVASMRQAAGRQPRWYAWTLASVMPALALLGACLCALAAG